MGSDVEAEMVTRLRLAVARLARRLRTEGDSDLTPSQISALATLDRFGELTVGEMAEIEHIRPPSITRIVAALAEAGLVERRVDPDDRRVARIRLTRVGEKAVTRIRAARSAFLASRFGSLPDHEQSAIEKALPALEHLLDDGRAR